MIRINVLGELSKEQLELIKLHDAIAAFRAAYKLKSFSGRHPDLGRMVNCPHCLRRHRAIEVCRQVFATGTHDHRPEGERTLLKAPETRNGLFGAKNFAKRRVHPHPNLRGLRLVQRTQELYPRFAETIEDPMAAMKKARTEAGRQLRAEYANTRRKKVAQQNLSRKINRRKHGT